MDKEGFKRKTVRAKWWIPIRPGMTHAEAAMPGGEIRGEGRVPDGVFFSGYGDREPVIILRPLLVDLPTLPRIALPPERRVPGLQRRLRWASGRLSIRRRANLKPRQVRSGGMNSTQPASSR